MRTFEFRFVVTCASNGKVDADRVEELLDLSMQELVFDDEFVSALDEKESVTIQVIPLFGNKTVDTE
jgi:archaellin